MNAIRIRKRLDSPIPQLPELDPLVGRDVEIIVLDDSKTRAGGVPGGSPSLAELAARQGVKPAVRFEDLKGGWPDDGLGDDFEAAVGQWRQEPWRSGGDDLPAEPDLAA